MPTAIRPGKRRAASRATAGSRTATVPSTTRSTPARERRLDRREVAQAAAELHADAARARDDRRTASVLHGRPARAPSRSTTCRRGIGWRAKPAATSAGSSEYTVARW